MENKWHKLWILVGMLLVFSTVLWRCDSTTEVSSDGPGEFEQTWPKSYGETSCSEWLNDMTFDQQRIAAADMLVGAREVDGGTELPDDALIASFQTEITEGCQPIGELEITEAAVVIYMIDPATYGP